MTDTNGHNPNLTAVREYLAGKGRVVQLLEAIDIYDQPFMKMQDLADHLRLSYETIRRMVDFDPVTGRAREGSQFPNAYKPVPSRTAPIRIPLCDVEAFKGRQVRGLDISTAKTVDLHEKAAG